jgi:hypothetical protein
MFLSRKDEVTADSANNDSDVSYKGNTKVYKILIEKLKGIGLSVYFGQC